MGPFAPIISTSDSKLTVMSTSSNAGSLPVSQEAIAVRAREIWVNRGCPSDQDLDIWLEAERQLSVSPAPLATPKSSGKGTRKGRVNVSAKPASTASESDAISTGELENRLNDFGTPNQRSATSVDLTGKSPG